MFSILNKWIEKKTGKKLEDDDRMNGSKKQLDGFELVLHN